MTSIDDSTTRSPAVPTESWATDANLKVSPFNQLIYNLGAGLQKGCHQPGRLRRVLFRLIQRLWGPWRSVLLRENPVVRVNLWNRELVLKSDHHLPHIVRANPLWSYPLVCAVKALDKENVQVIDVGANIGDTVALLDSYLPEVCRFLCIEPDESFYKLCVINTSANHRTIVRKSFVGDTGGSLLVSDHMEPGNAGTKIVNSADDSKESVGELARPLDEIAAAAIPDARIDIIKVDTDGFDFKVLRSAVRILRNDQPLLFFEWIPALWANQGDDPLDVFRFLSGCGYGHCVFFSNDGFLHSAVSIDDEFALQSLRSAIDGRDGIDNLYFDVLVGPPEICSRAMKFAVEACQSLARRNITWKRIQPEYWTPESRL